jgi:dTDP-4-dehydro-6-deoxy-alpha-D-glucopyranose 2,3-dehydratase
MFGSIDDFSMWFDERRQASRCSVRQAPLDALTGWPFPPESGNLVHESGRFLSVKGIEVETDHREVSLWMQPILVQPEIGIPSPEQISHEHNRYFTVIGVEVEDPPGCRALRGRGRFNHAENRYLVIDAGDDVGLDVPDDYIWMTVPQRASSVPYGNYVNVAARSLLGCMGS